MTQRYIDIAFDDATPRSFGGFDNENEATVIRLKVLTSDAKYYLEIERACAKHDKYCSDALPVADGYAVFEVPRDFTHETLYVQGVMKVDGMCRKTARVRVGFSRSINALDELPESHPSWADSIEKQLGNLDDLTTKDKGSLVAAINETAKSGGGAADAVTYTPQNLTEEQQEQARENITVAKSYQIPTTTINDNEVRVDGWAAVPIGIGRPSGFSIILSDVLNGALPFFVANGTVFLCTGVDSSGADKVLTFVGFASSGSLSAITYKNARWKDGLQVIYIYPGSVDPNDIDYCAKVTYYYVGSYGYIYGPSYKELMEERDFAVKHPLAVVNGKFDNAILPLTCVDDVNKSITYARIDVLPSGAHQIRGLTIADGQPLHIIDLTTPPPYTVPASGIPKSDLAEDVQTSLAKADTAISLGLTAATPGQIIKVKAVQDGKPTEWEAVDMPSEGVEWYEVIDMETAENVNDLIISTDKNGRPISGYHALAMVLCFKIPADSTQTSTTGKIWVYPMGSNNLTSVLRIISDDAGWETIARTYNYLYAGSNRAIFVSGATGAAVFNETINNVFDGVRLFIHTAGDHLPAGTKVRCLVLSKGWMA